MIGDVVRANAERKPNLVMTEEERAALEARREATEASPWGDEYKPREPTPEDDGVTYEQSDDEALDQTYVSHVQMFLEVTQ